MAVLSLNEIKLRAQGFVLNWKDKAATAREEADAQTFENEFFAIFGVPRSKIAIFEQKVKLQDGSNGYIDLFWKGYILIEMKTPGKDRKKAFEQAKTYANALSNSDMPKGILICDFCNFDYYNLEKNAECTSFTLGDLPDYIGLFAFLAGYKDVEYKKQDAVNIEAAEKMGQLHDTLKDIGYKGHSLELYLVRLVFCLFADDTDIFEHDHFIKYILQRTNVDGSDLAMHIQKIFEVLNTPADRRLRTLDEQLSLFPYVNGGLFKETLPIADFTSAMREKLIQCCSLDWSKISPAIFGAMFQSVMNPDERHSLGAHYTSEENILKLIHPLFLDELWKEFDEYKKQVSGARIKNLNGLHTKIASLKFLDPACGCGNFLVLAYRELRLLELAIVEELENSGQQILDIDNFLRVTVNQFYGIEIEEFPAQIAQTALWLMDHQMNRLVSSRLGRYFIRIPIASSATIIQGNALNLDWEQVVPKKEISYILGNPPFLGARVMSKEQSAEIACLFNGVKNAGNLDYVTGWYKKAADYIKDTTIKCAFVSTNSICQGQQVPILWPLLFSQGIHIDFAHQTFKWSNEARGNAAVYCIIVGFSLNKDSDKKLFLYEDVKGVPKEVPAKQINAYLMDAQNVFIDSRTIPIDPVSEMGIGNKPIDGGNYLFLDNEKEEFIKQEPQSAAYFKCWYGSDEFINNKIRWCLWLGDCPPHILKKMPHALKRIENVRTFRLLSKSEGTRKIADTPTRFHVENMPETGHYLLIPRVSSERRRYIPIGFLDVSVIASDSTLIVPNATLYEFGILTSQMHMAWTRTVCGRLEMRYRYSAQIVYNNFPWPEASETQKESIAQKAQAVLDARNKFPESSLADLYDPDTMPSVLVKAHAALDSAVDKLYRKTAFSDDAARTAHLFELYLKKTEGLLAGKRGM
ncbi:class I SAM-dependent DNA methyltransferase [Treponema denticola]|uniref:site-specific DNA-methyltransferase (adenine-specific) n=1 Tax=Treponema denticola TaxID=158 RepID=A0A9Q9BJ99_TREDN|nr:DNA methyltransferase [Treponema denticola]UTC90607.1 class I SAM-dependent DNA methyltransferase [Treponema denticola]UTD00042.1 class I SAM-dependent DNA methyltransferase [Treponema denticola]